MRFALSVEPVAGESLPGYLMRLAHRARLPEAGLVAARAGLRQPGSAFEAQGLEQLAAMAGVEHGSLDRMAYRPLPRVAHHRFLDGSLHREFIDVSGRRLCLHCLRASPHHRAAWDFALAVACPQHGVRLLDRCPACRRKFGWNQPDLCRCRCGADLAYQPGVPVSQAERASQATAAALASGGPLPSMPSALAGCDRADLVRLVMCLGMFLSEWGRQRRVETLVGAGANGVAEVVRLGLDCLEGWPGPLHRFLAAQRRHSEHRPGRYGARKTIGPFYDWLNLMSPGAIRTTMSEAAAVFVHEDAVLARRVHRSSLVALPDPAARTVLGAVEAGRQLGRRSGAVRKLVQAGLLAGETDGGRGMPSAIGAASVARLAVEMADGFDLAGVARRLAISKGRVRRLVEGGLLEPVHRGNADGWGRWVFRCDDVEAFVAALEGTAPAVVGPSPAHMGFETAVEVLRRRGIGIADMLGAVVGGRLAAVSLCEGASGLKRLCFAAPEVRALAVDMGDGPATLSLQAAAARLGIKWEVAAHLVKAGLLRGTDAGVDQAAVDAFAAEYVSGGVLARRLGTSPRSLAGKLAARGVLPLVGPGVDGSRQNFYRSRDAALTMDWLSLDQNLDPDGSVDERAIRRRRQSRQQAGPHDRRHDALGGEDEAGLAPTTVRQASQRRKRGACT